MCHPLRFHKGLVKGAGEFSLTLILSCGHEVQYEHTKFFLKQLEA